MDGKSLEPWEHFGCRKYTNHGWEFEVWRIAFFAQEARTLDWKGCMQDEFRVFGAEPKESEVNLFSPLLEVTICSCTNYNRVTSDLI